PRFVHGNCYFQKRCSRATGRGRYPALEIYGRNRLPVFGPRAFSRKALRTCVHAHCSGNDRDSTRRFPERNCRSTDRSRRAVLQVQSRMNINHGGARSPGAPGTRVKRGGSAIRPYLLLALFFASCAAPDTQHHIVISTRDQKLAVLDRSTLMVTYPVSTSKFG